jgi:hypothetical protein
MDIESGIEMKKEPLYTKGVASLPSPKTHKEMIAEPGFNPEDDDVYLKKLPEWTMWEMTITGIASGSGMFLMSCRWILRITLYPCAKG